MATYTVTITDADETALNDVLLDKNAWIQAAVTGKINNCKKRMCAEWRKILYADESVTQIPNDDYELVALIIARDDYKNREEIDAEQEAKE